MAMNKSNITRPMVVVIVALVAALMIAPTSASASANDVVDGGVQTKKKLLNAYDHQSDVRALYDSKGVTRSALKHAKTARICASQGFTSTGREYTKGSHKIKPDGNTFYARPLSSVMHGCASAWKVKTKNGYVYILKFCGNLEYKKSKKKGKKKGCGCKKPSPPPKVVCANTGVMVDSIQQCVTQTQQTTQDCQAGTIKQGNQCVVIQNQCGNVNVGGDNNTQGGNCNVVNECSNVNSPGGVVNCNVTPTCEQAGTCPPPPKCPDGRPIPPNGDCDRPPIGEVVASAAHVQLSNDPTAPSANKHVELYFEGSDPDGDDLSLDILLSAPAGTYVSGKRKVTVGYNNQPCPAGKTCWQATLWSGTATGDAIVRGKFSAGNKSFTTEPITVKVEGDTFPQN